MATPLNTLGEQLKALATGWTSYAALGSFLLYVLGYLTLRFHLTALGVGTDLAVLGERYLFAGTKFVVYLVSAVPISYSVSCMFRSSDTGVGSRARAGRRYGPILSD